MRLNPDCTRDVLLQIEETQVVGAINRVKTLYMRDILTTDMEEKYTAEDIFYSTKQLLDKGYLSGREIFYIRGGDIEINDISPSGHSFLENIRDTTIWNKVKAKSNKLGAISLEIISTIASKLIAEMIDKGI